MAERRMFSKRIINSARFLKMPASTQALYFHLGLNADDDGVVEAYIVMNQMGASEDDLKLLVAKKFVIVLNEDLVAYITDWRENNYIRADRKVDSIYKDLLLQFVPEIEVQKKRKPKRKSVNAQHEQTSDNQVPDISQSSDGQPSDMGQPMDGIGKVRLGKDRLGQDSLDIEPPETENYTLEFINFWKAYPRKQHKQDAYKAYVIARNDGATAEQLVQGAKTYAKYLEINQKSTGWTTMPENWLDKKLWTDELDLTPPMPKGKQKNVKETLPDWAKDDNQQSETKKKLTVEQQEQLKARLRRLNAKKISGSE